MSITFKHQSVMPEEVMAFFADALGKTLVDATAGGGGHLALLASAVGSSGRVLAFDRDVRAHQEDAAKGVLKHFPDTMKLFHQPFSSIRQTLASEGIKEIDGLLCDLGVSSNQLDDATRGFSFMSDGPIDMRMDQSTGLSAYEWLAKSSESDIADAIYQYGGEKKSRAIARKIKASWPIKNSTMELARIVLSALRMPGWSKTHPATRTFQALRIAANNELGELVQLLDDLPLMLAPQGVAVFLSFHSLEDRLIKNAFKKMAQADAYQDKRFAILTKKPTVASDVEVGHNRRSRSAKLRALKRIS